MFNRSEILIDAWKRYRSLATVRFGAPFSRKSFGNSLRMAWAFAELQAERAAALLVPVAAYEPRVETVRERAIHSELLAIDTASRVDWSRRNALTAELNGIEW